MATDVFDPTGSVESSYASSGVTGSGATADPTLPVSNVITSLAGFLGSSTGSADSALILIDAGIFYTQGSSTLSEFLGNLLNGAESNGVVINGAVPGDSNYPAQAAGAEEAIYQGMLQDYADATGIVLTTNNSTSPPTITSTVPPADYSDFTNPNNPFVQVFNGFLSTYQPAPFNSGFGVKTNSFLTQFQQFLLGPGVTTSGPITSLSAYAAYYNANVLNGSPVAYAGLLNAFIANESAPPPQGKGFFLPNASLADFKTFISNTQTTINNIIAAGKTGGLISGTESSKAIIINRILALIISIINALQNVGIAQANNLTYLTQYQNAYTALLQQMPTFLANGTQPIGIAVSKGGGTTAENDRNDINSSLNGVFTSNLQSLRTIQSNNAKTVQSNLNTTNDAVNQQTDMATTFLQQMSQLLGAIFR